MRPAFIPGRELIRSVKFSRRINPDSGVVEELSEPIDPVSDGQSNPLVNEHGTNERINPDTGVTEKRGALLDDLVGSDWLPKKP